MLPKKYVAGGKFGNRSSPELGIEADYFLEMLRFAI